MLSVLSNSQYGEFIQFEFDKETPDADYAEGKLFGVKNGPGERCQTLISAWPHKMC
jgi:hypothetical protein